MWRIRVAIGLASLMLSTAPAGSETLVVTNAADGGVGSLRYLINYSNENGEPDTIVFDDDYTIMLRRPLPTIYFELEIRGNGWGRTVIDGTFSWGGLSVHREASATIEGLTIRNVPASAIESTGYLVVESCRFENNTSRSYGGAIGIVGSHSLVTVRSSTFVGNFAQGPGGAIGVLQGNLDVEGCFFGGNEADASVTGGGAIGVAGGQSAYVRIANSTFSQNHSQTSGGALHFSYGLTADLIGITMTDNTAAESGTAIHAEFFAGPIRISHSIIDGDCSIGYLGEGAIVSLGHNIESGDTCGLDPAIGDLIDTDPGLCPLGSNGGPTWTHALLAGSPAIDGGAPECGLVADQRGYPRPVDGDDDGTIACDVGAFEQQQPVFADGFESSDTSMWSVPGAVEAGRCWLTALDATVDPQPRHGRGPPESR